MIGSYSDARLAGNKPNTKPTKNATPKDKTIDHQDMTVGISAELAISLAVTIPSITPIRPPRKQMKTASNKNCKMISIF